MGIKVLIVVAVFLLEVQLGSGLPKPQPQSSEDYDEIYLDYEYPDTVQSSSGSDLGSLLKVGAGLAQTFGGLLSQKLNFIKELLSGLNLTGELFRAIQALAGSSQAVLAPRNIVSNSQVQARVGSVAAAGGDVVQGLGQIGAVVPRFIGEGARYAGSFVAAANEAAPLVVEGFQDFQKQIPLIRGFAQAYAEVNAEQAQLVRRTFQRSLECNLKCGNLSPGSAKNACEAEHCVKIEQDDQVKLRRYYSLLTILTDMRTSSVKAQKISELIRLAEVSSPPRLRL